MNRVEELECAIAAHGRLVVLFSGGLDSSLLAKLAYDALGCAAEALTIDSDVIPRSENVAAEAIAANIGIRRHVLHLNELQEDYFSSNPPDRCYYCRKLRDAVAWRWAGEHGFEVIADGLNYSDLSDYRPGLKAADEDRIWHPFIEFRVSKDEIRTLSRDLGLKDWGRPSMACLASRFPHGFAVTPQRAARVDSAEEYLHSLGFEKVRVRYFPHDLAVVEVDDAARAIALRAQLVSRLRDLGFSFVSLDMEDFASGKMNRTIEP